MNIQNALWKLLHKPRGQQPHISRETNQINAVLLESRDDFAIMFLAGLAFRGNHQSIQPALAGSRDSWRVRPVRDDNADPRIRNSPRRNTVRNGDKVRPAPRKKYAQRFHGKLSAVSYQLSANNHN